MDPNIDLKSKKTVQPDCVMRRIFDCLKSMFFCSLCLKLKIDYRLLCDSTFLNHIQVSHREKLGS